MLSKTKNLLRASATKPNEKAAHELVMRCVWQARDMIYNSVNLLKSFQAPACAIMKKIKYVELDARLSRFASPFVRFSVGFSDYFFINKISSENESPVGDVVRQLMTLAGDFDLVIKESSAL
jgi:hypothetical protein